jgi:hypothetical protein
MVEAGKLRYWGLGFYAGLVALWTGLDKLPLNEQTGITLLAPIAAVIAADYWKHKSDSSN